MVKVVATEKGYFGSVVRELGESFNIPHEIWTDEKKRPKWVKLDPKDAFGGKGDHDGDGSVGGSKPGGHKAGEKAIEKSGDGDGKAGEKPADTIEVPADWQNLHHSKRKALAKVISGSAVADLATADNVIAAYVEANKPPPFSDAPVPQTVMQAQKEAGGIKPDWEAPGEGK